MSEICIICLKSIDPKDSATLHEKGLKSLQESSKQRQDGLYLRLNSAETPQKVHVLCRKNYTRPSTIAKARRESEHLFDENIEPPAKRRSQTPVFDIKNDCLYCCKPTEQDKNNYKTTTSSSVETLDYIKNVITKADERGDAWGSEVKLRIQLSSDLVAAEGKYHRRCAQLFYKGSSLDNTCAGDRGRPLDQDKSKGFEQLCTYLDTNNECQYSITELYELYESFSGGGGGGSCGNGGGDLYTQKRLHQRLIDHYGEEMVITCMSGKPTVYSFRDHSHRILREKWIKDRKMDFSDTNDIIDLAASIIRDEIRTKVYDSSEYPDMSDLSQAQELVPSSLDRLLRGIFKSKPNSSSERRITAIAHSIIAACRPRSFVSPILLAISVYIHRKYASRELIDILSSMSFSDNYREVQKLSSVYSLESEPNYDLSKFTQFVFDNADINIATLTGHDTFHSMGGIACITPPGETRQQNLKRPKNIPDTELTGKFGQIEVEEYHKPAESGLKSTIIGPLVPAGKPQPNRLKHYEAFDVLWQCSLALGLHQHKTPSWSGFMQILGSPNEYQQSRWV